MTVETGGQFGNLAADDVLRGAVLTGLTGDCELPQTAALETLEPPGPRRAGIVTVYRRARSSAWTELLEVAGGEARAYFWEACWCKRLLGSYPGGLRIVIERAGPSCSEQYPNLTLTSVAPCAETESTPFRGVFKLAVKRRVLFSADVQYRIAELPRKKPKVWIDRRVLEADDE